MDFLKLFGRTEKKSKNVAKERLKLVLINDRANVSPRFLEMIKDDIVKVISNYAIINEDGLDIKLTKTRSNKDNKTISALVANIPIEKIKDDYKDCDR